MFGIGGFIKEEINRFWCTKHKQDWNFMGEFFFENRSRNQEKLLLVLAGYKEFLYEDVFSRIEKYIDDDIDVCICVSGKEDSTLKSIAKKKQMVISFYKRGSFSTCSKFGDSRTSKCEVHLQTR